MYLLIDLSSRDDLHLALFDEQSIFEEHYEGKNRKLLLCMDRLFATRHLRKEEIQGIMVVVGAGGFTNTRIGTTVANAFAYAYHIPLLAVTVDQVSDIQKLLPELLHQPRGQYISATYSGEPNIT